MIISKLNLDIPVRENHGTYFLARSSVRAIIQSLKKRGCKWRFETEGCVSSAEHYVVRCYFQSESGEETESFGESKSPDTFMAAVERSLQNAVLEIVNQCMDQPVEIENDSSDPYSCFHPGSTYPDRRVSGPASADGTVFEEGFTPQIRKRSVLPVHELAVTPAPAPAEPAKNSGKPETVNAHPMTAASETLPKSSDRGGSETSPSVKTAEQNRLHTEPAHVVETEPQPKGSCENAASTPASAVCRVGFGPFSTSTVSDLCALAETDLEAKATIALIQKNPPTWQGFRGRGKEIKAEVDKYMHRKSNDL